MSAKSDSPEGTPKKKWVQFDEEDKSGDNVPTENSSKQNGSATGGGASEIAESPSSGTSTPRPTSPAGTSGAAVIPTVSVEIKPERTPRQSSPSTGTTEKAVIDIPLQDPPNGNSAVIRTGFTNGDIIVTLLPVNTRFPWITPAQFRPELVPEELMAQGLTLTVEDYVHVMEILTNDMRFSMYNICYKRVLVVWIMTAFLVLLGLLFSGLSGLLLFGLGCLWLVLNASAIFFCMWVKIKLNRNLEKCMANVNKHLLKHRIILGLDDRGRISCHKVNLCFIYFDTSECLKKLQEVIEREEAAGRILNREETSEQKKKRKQFAQKMDIEDHDIIIQGSHTTRLSRKQERATMLMLRYSSRWAKQFVRKCLEIGGAATPPSITGPRHCPTSACPCQFIEDHLKYKPRDSCCGGAYSYDPHSAFMVY